MFQNHIRYRYYKVLLASVIMLTGMAGVSFGQKLSSKRKDLEAQRIALQQEILQNKKVLEQARARESNSLNQLNIISTQINTRVKIIDNIGQEAFELSLEIDGQQKAIETLNRDLERLKKDYAESIVAAYKRRNVNDAMLFVFDSKNFNQAYKRLRYLNQYGEYRLRQGRLILNTRQAIADAITDMLAARKKKVTLMSDKEREKLELEKDKKEEAVLYTQLQQKVKTLKQQLDEKEKSAKKLNKAIQDLIAKEIEAARKAEEARMRKAAEKAAREAAAKNRPRPTEKDTRTANSYLTAADLKLSNDFAGNKGRLPWPVPGTIAETFGPHTHPTLKGVVTTNNGIDISVKAGAVAQAVFNGKVKAIFSIPGMDRVVLVNHGEYFTVYARLAVVNVKIGDEVKTGMDLGTVAVNAEDGTSRFHLEIYKQRELQNPQLWLRK